MSVTGNCSVGVGALLPGKGTVDDEMPVWIKNDRLKFVSCVMQVTLVSKHLKTSWLSQRPAHPLFFFLCEKVSDSCRCWSFFPI